MYQNTFRLVIIFMILCAVTSEYKFTNCIQVDGQSEKWQEINLQDLIKDDRIVSSQTDSLSTLNNLASIHKLQYEFEVKSSEGLPHAKIFTINLRVGNESYTGVGTSIKKAKRNAAEIFLKETDLQKPVPRIKNPHENTPTVKLNNLAAKYGLPVIYDLIDNIGSKYYLNASAVPKNSTIWNSFHSDEKSTKGPFTIRVTIGDYDYLGLGHTIQQARHEAAQKALNKFQEDQILFCYTNDCRQKKSPISLLYELSQKHNLNLDYKTKQVDTNQFETLCHFHILKTVGYGKSKKLSKRKATETMLNHINAIYGDLDTFLTLNTQKKQEKVESSFSFKNIIENIIPRSSKIDQEKNKKRQKSVFSPKSELFHVAKLLNVKILTKNDALNRKHRNETISRIYLDLQPSYMCYALGLNINDAVNMAAQYALRLMYQSVEFLDQIDRDHKLKRELENCSFYIQLMSDIKSK